MPSNNKDKTRNENVNIVDVSVDGNEQLMIVDNIDDEIKKIVDGDENATIFNIIGISCDEDGNVVKGLMSYINGDVFKAGTSDLDMVVNG